jgi:predicted cytidylate kinase
MRITLNGTLGSGKSTVGKELAPRLGVRYVSTGQIFRELGHISNLDALQTNLEAETNSALDEAVDNKVRELNKSDQDFVIDSRMAWHFIDNALHVFLSVTPEVAARRVMEDRTRLIEQYSTLHSAMDSLRARRDSELKRYRRLYAVDIENPANYALWVITDDAEVADVVELIMRRVEGRTNEARWIPKTRLVPMIPVGSAEKPVVRDPGVVPLPLSVAENFGFFSGDSQELAQAFSSELNLVPYEEHVPEAMAGRDPIAFARSTVKATDLRQWEFLSGVPLSFTQRLAVPNRT